MAGWGGRLERGGPGLISCMARWGGEDCLDGEDFLGDVYCATAC